MSDIADDIHNYTSVLSDDQRRRMGPRLLESARNEILRLRVEARLLKAECREWASREAAMVSGLGWTAPPWPALDIARDARTAAGIKLEEP